MLVDRWRSRYDLTSRSQKVVRPTAPTECVPAGIPRNDGRTGRRCSGAGAPWKRLGSGTGGSDVATICTLAADARCPLGANGVTTKLGVSECARPFPRCAHIESSKSMTNASRSRSHAYRRAFGCWRPSCIRTRCLTPPRIPRRHKRRSSFSAADRSASRSTGNRPRPLMPRTPGHRCPEKYYSCSFSRRRTPS